MKRVASLEAYNLSPTAVYKYTVPHTLVPKNMTVHLLPFLIAPKVLKAPLLATGPSPGLVSLEPFVPGRLRTAKVASGSGFSFIRAPWRLLRAIAGWGQPLAGPSAPLSWSPPFVRMGDQGRVTTPGLVFGGGLHSGREPLGAARSAPRNGSGG